MEASNTRKTYVVTGSTSGIGLATAEALMQVGADVIGVGRSEDRCRKTEAYLNKLNPKVSVQYFCADFSVQAEVRELANKIRAYLAVQGKSKLDGLVNNAGTFTYWLALTPDGIETQWAVNHLAGFLLTHELLPYLQSAQQARVITVSSDSHYGIRINWADPQLRRNYNGLQAYGVTKLANVLFTQELNHRLEPGSSVQAFAVDPGLVKTDIGLKGTPALVNWVWKLRRFGGTSADVPAKCIQYLLTNPSVQSATAIYWKDSRPKRASKATEDRTSAARLWTLSENLCGLAQQGEKI